MDALTELPNVGPVLRDHLLAIGVTTPNELAQLGTRETFLRIRTQRDPGACLSLLYGIQGALMGIPDKHLPPETRAELKSFYDSL